MPRRKLNEQQVKIILVMAQEGWMQKKIAEIFGITHAQVSNIILKKHWQYVNVTPEEEEQILKIIRKELGTPPTKRPQRNLSKDEVKIIIIMAQDGWVQKKIASILKISNQQVSNIIHKKIWKHINVTPEEKERVLKTIRKELGEPPKKRNLPEH